MTGIAIEPIIEYRGCDFGTRKGARLPMQKQIDGSEDFEYVKQEADRLGYLIIVQCKPGGVYYLKYKKGDIENEAHGTPYFIQNNLEYIDQRTNKQILSHRRMWIRY